MGANCLVIVESPGKVKTIQKYLDSLFPETYEVMASFGHICDLPKKDLGFNTSTFEPHYEVYEEKQDIVRKLKSAAKRCGEVILATDDDREGEAIAYHLKRELGLKNPDRITFTSITKDALETALKNARKIDQKKVDSQETRRLLDRMIGWLVSPVARNYVVPDSSMGRVQTAVLMLLVDLERRIRNFKSTQHYGVEAYMLDKETPWNAVWDTSPWLQEGQDYWLDRASAEKISQIKQLKVVSVKNGTSETQPPAPFITSTLQRAAQKVLKLSPKKTMELAQKLYEAGAITYMRTDNPNLSPDAYVALKKYAVDNDLPVEDSQRKFKTKAGAQEAHEAIRPTSFMIKEVGQGDIQALYDLIWMRSVACQLKAAKYDTREVVLEQDVSVAIDGVMQNKTATFKARGRTLTYGGWLQLTDKDFSEIEDEDKEAEPNNPIPGNLSEGDVIEVSNCQLREKKTTPPSRLTASALIAKLESSGVGRPSTYASIIETIENRNYITYEKSRIFVTDRGIKIIDTMENKFKFIDVKYTAEVEESLDEIANGKEWYPITKNFWSGINQEVDDFIKYIHSTLPQHKCEVCQSLVIKKETDKGAYWKCISCPAKYADGTNKPGSLQVTKETDFKCEECGSNLVYRKGSFNGKDYEYFSCSSANNGANKCFAKYEILSGSNPATPDFEKYREQSKYKCTLCERKLLYRIANKDDPAKARPFWVCSGVRKENTLCTAFYNDKNGAPDYEAFDLDHKYCCAECGGFLARKKYKDKPGHFWMCNNIPKGKKKSCGLFYDDLNMEPDYDKFQRDREHKCGNCGSFLRFIEKDDKKFWRCTCPGSKCGWVYEDDLGRPNFEAAKEKYIHKCPNCKLGFMQKRKNDNGFYWSCSSFDCKTFLPDEGGTPDLNYKKPEKKAKK